MAADFDDFQVTVARKPVPGVVQGEIPPKLAEYLEKQVPGVLANPADFELTLTAKDESQAKKLAGYAKAWGARQEPRLRITKVPNGKTYPENIARLSVVKDEDVPVESRPGRKAGK